MPFKSYQLFNVGHQKTNWNFLFFSRVSLTLYNYQKPSGNWGPRHFLYKFAAKPPVLLSSVNPDLRLLLMKQLLFDQGHFDSDIKVNYKYYGKDQKKVQAIYTIYMKSAYKYHALKYLPTKSKLDNIIQKQMSSSLIIAGNDYWLAEMKNERVRLERIIRNQGYYYFNKNYLLFDADTTVNNKEVDLTLRLKENNPDKSNEVFSLNKVFVNMESLSNVDTTTLVRDTLLSNNYYYNSFGKKFKPKHITRGVSLKTGFIYNHDDHSNTIRYLQGMGAFRSVDIVFKEVKNANNQLNAFINLKPVKPIETSIEVTFATKSNDFLGPAAKASISHSNIFKGAEKLILQIDGGFEWQKRGKRKEYDLGLNSYEIGVMAKIVFPRFLMPFSIKYKYTKYVPKTYTSIGFRSLKRIKYYLMNVSQIKFGYKWKTSNKNEFIIEPVSIDYLRVAESSQEFNDFLLQHPQVAKSFEKQFIIGSRFSYTFISKTDDRKISHFYNNVIVDIAGNLLNATYNLFGLKNSGDTDSELFGVPYAQFSRITNDFRYSLRFHKKLQIASRFLVGVGVPYKNSTVLPYVKQYFAGGSQDLRAFYARTVGPGTYFQEPQEGNAGFLDQAGEIKLEGNIEFRFPVLYKVSGAFFVDAGNIWLINKDPSRPGGEFKFNSFLNQFAIGSGVGLRIDLNYFILRLDAAVPVRKPYLPTGENLIFQNSSFWSDYIISLAVGYPF